MFRFLLAVVFAFSTVTAFAAEPDTTAIKAALARMFPGVQVETLKIRTSPIPGLMEAEIDTTVFYVTTDGKHVLVGDLLDTQNRRNLSDVRRQALSAKIIDEIPEKNMIILGSKQARKTITVFTDVDCGYCRRLHVEDVPELTKQGVRVRYILFPRQGPGTETYNRSVSVWCAADRVKAVGEAKAGKQVAAKTCANPIDENLALVERLGVNGTPAIFLEDGRRLPGYVPAQKMLVMLGLKADSQPVAKPN
jgi:thiol:disulfide interchange protein DsbC